MARSTLSKK